MDNILILDGMERSALAATRSLGKRGYNVFVSDAAPKSLAGASKYCQRYFQLTSPETNPNEFVDELVELISKYAIDALLPMSDISTATVLNAPAVLSAVNLPCPSFNTYNDVTNKSSLFQLAAKNEIPIPHTYFIDHIDEIDTITDQLRYPIVIKPSQSRVLFENQWIRTHVCYANNTSELLETLKKHKWLTTFPFMLQEYISGQGRGIFAFYNKGHAVTFFSHKRLREKPPSGGVSVLCESTAVDPVMQSISKKLLDAVGWHGVAMVEFKVDANGTPYLMEINGRFWGSLQLAIDAGIDFPYMAYLLAQGREIPSPPSYKVGIKSRWLLGDLDHLYLRLKQSGKTRGAGKKLGDIYNFLKLYQRNTRYEINRADDLSPFIFELQRYLKNAG